MIILTKHVKTRLRERNITERHVGWSLTSPDFTLPGKTGSKIAIKKIGSRFLKTVFRRQNGDIIVITTHWISKARIKVE